MIKVPTAHNEAKKGDIANLVIMPGDPLRAEYIAKKFLKDAFCYNKVRNMYGFTGMYNDVRVSVQASGMGIPSMGIYSKELYEGYDVDLIIRVGSAGTLNEDINLMDIIIAENVDSDSEYNTLIGLNKDTKVVPSSELLDITKKISEENLKDKNDINIKYGKVFTSEVFYDSKERLEKLDKDKNIAFEMETFALYSNAILANKKALSLLTISDHLLRDEHLTSDKRQNSFDKMIETALHICIRYNKERKK